MLTWTRETAICRTTTEFLLGGRVFRSFPADQDGDPQARTAHEARALSLCLGAEERGALGRRTVRTTTIVEVAG